jgi:uncharacterized membrane protein
MSTSQPGLSEPFDANVKDTSRVEAFSDGVIAIAITLLAFQITVPTLSEATEEGGLLTALLNNWPEYLAFATSFIIILILWINHHRLFKMLRVLDHNALILNGLLLMNISLVPFVSDLVAEYLRTPSANTAAAIYCLVSLGLAVIFNVFWRYVSSHRRLILGSVPQEAIDAVNRQYRFGPLIYVAALVLSLVTAFGGLGIIIVNALWFALPSRRSEVAN